LNSTVRRVYIRSSSSSSSRVHIIREIRRFVYYIRTLLSLEACFQRSKLLCLGTPNVSTTCNIIATQLGIIGLEAGSRSENQIIMYIIIIIIIIISIKLCSVFVNTAFYMACVHYWLTHTTTLVEKNLIALSHRQQRSVKCSNIISSCSSSMFLFNHLFIMFFILN
jgi:hypothetical protein